MEELFQLNPIILTTLLFLILLWPITKILANSSGKKTPSPPPSPLKLPVIGNLHQLGSLPHHDLHSLAQKHGPVMLLHFGSVPTLIVSSATWAREIMKTHDLKFASRPAYKTVKKLSYDCRDVAAAPHGEYWRKMKSILVLQLLSSKRVEAARAVVQEETALFVEKIRGSCGAAVNLSEMFAKLNNDVVCRSAFGRKYSESENGKKFLLLQSDLMELLGRIDIGDFIPWLGWISRVTGVDKRFDRVVKEMDQVLECVVQERLEIQERFGDCFVDIMLEIEELSIHNRDSIKALILDVFTGGTDTTFTALEWTMAELLRHPTVMEKLQSEVRGILQQKHHIITNDDLEKMHYLKAVIKEAFRYHPPLPLLVPRIAREDVQIKGYNISAGTVVMINAWAIGRDAVSWDEPEKFKPERFLNSSTDLKGLHFELLPFGSGRRGCPGITFALATIELLLANLMLKFDWKLPNEVQGKDLDMNEAPGITVHKAIPLLAVASQSE